MKRVAVVEDNPDLLDDVLFTLSQAGYAARGYADGAALFEDMGRFGPQLVVLDLGLPGEDGLVVAARLRQAHPGLGIIMLTARTALVDRVTGLSQGADSYLCKPVEMSELVAHVGAVLRRCPPAPAPVAWCYAPRRLCLRGPQGQEMALSSAESLIVHRLALTPGQEVSRRDLVHVLGQSYEHYDERRLEAIVSRLRRKILAAVPEANPLRGLRNRGYVFLDPIEIEAGGGG